MSRYIHKLDCRIFSFSKPLGRRFRVGFDSSLHLGSGKGARTIGVQLLNIDPGSYLAETWSHGAVLVEKIMKMRNANCSTCSTRLVC